TRRSRVGTGAGNAPSALLKPGSNHDDGMVYLESVRTLRNSILLSNLDRRPKTILITSAGAGEGKTMTAVHLAMSHAGQNRKTLLIDCDFRRPSVQKYILHDGMNTSVGLSKVLSEGTPWADALVKLEDPSDLHVLPAGASGTRHPADLLGERFDAILAEATALYDLVIIDSPPILGFAESIQLAANVNAVVLVSVAGKTKRKAIRSVLERLRRVRAPILGMILNKTSRDGSDSGHQYYYGYYTDKSNPPAVRYTKD
ncbi:MAG: CpsD/CapB family tyrosine-protein kinase, partial [Acidobacteriota bacterium]|nr:CpsD/CapB family tyrosine-protein kinase [Acidobacteriota bacterium]